MNKTLQIGIGVVLLLAVAGGSFYAGTVYGKNQAARTAAAQFVGRQQGRLGGVGVDGMPFGGAQVPGGQGQFNVQGDQPSGGARFGQIAEINGDTLVVTDADNNQVQVKVTETTLIEKNASVTAADLVAGDTVIISGSQNEDGSITARSIQVAPAGRMGFPGAGGAPGGQGPSQ